ncbi:MAG: hypothetical protein FJ125_16805, partial [Deltaproteobacteria bacterium]|nr:hypothetical protein [Deltaproteobacteria bacterium]
MVRSQANRSASFFVVDRAPVGQRTGGWCGVGEEQPGAGAGPAPAGPVRCATRDDHGRDACPARPLPAQAIEDFVVQRIREATADGSLAQDVTRRVTERLAEQRKVLQTERQALPPAIAKLSAEGRRLAEALRQADGPAHRLVEEQLQGVAIDLGRQEARLAEVERQLAHLDTVEVEAGWVTQVLGDFD